MFYLFCKKCLTAGFEIGAARVRGVARGPRNILLCSRPLDVGGEYHYPAPFKTTIHLFSRCQYMVSVRHTSMMSSLPGISFIFGPSFISAFYGVSYLGFLSFTPRNKDLTEMNIAIEFRLDRLHANGTYNVRQIQETQSHGANNIDPGDRMAGL